MNFKSEFETVDLVLDSNCETKGVDAFALSLIKAEKQMRRIFTFLVYQNPELQGKSRELREALAENRSVYFSGLIKGIERIFSVKIKELIGDEYDSLEMNMLEAITIRNKIFHGQITTKYLTTDDLRTIVNGIRKWCELLATSAKTKWGYDGFARNSMRKSETDIYSKYLIRLKSIDDYKDFVKKSMAR